MNRARLETLLAHLKTVPEEKFGISDWKCGTAACAIGHAGSIPEFKLAGFSCAAVPEVLSPNGSLIGWRAVTRFFDLDIEEARELFSGERYPDGDNTTLPEVIDRFSKFLEAT